MTNAYKYKTPAKVFKVSTFIVIILASILLLALIPAIKNLNIMPVKDIVIFLSISALCFIILLIALYDLRKNILIYKESKRNPNVITNDDFILLPFEKNKKRIKVFYSDILECDESYIFNKKDKSYFIHFLVVENKILNKPKVCEYRLYENNMENSEQYARLRDFLSRKVELKRY